MKKICIVTGSRAEFGLLRNIINSINKSDKLFLQMVVTGAHLSNEFGHTIDEIIEEDIKIDEQIEMLLSTDSPVGIGKSIGLGIISFSETLNRLSPDYVLIIGDRFEMIAVSVSCLVLNIPIAHISGGEITEGAVDEQIRHAITKMSHIHFTASDVNSEIVKQMGEEPWRVNTVGGLWIDNLKNVTKLSKQQIKKKLGVLFKSSTILVTYHPVTLDLQNVKNNIQILLSALDKIDAEIIFTYPNADSGGRIIIKEINKYINTHVDAKAFHSLGSNTYNSLLSYVDLVLGNSSSGMVETQYYKVPVVNVGDRQKGRLVTKNIICAEENEDDILQSIKKGLSNRFKESIVHMKNPYDEGGAAEKITAILSSLPDTETLLRKKFIVNNEI